MAPNTTSIYAHFGEKAILHKFSASSTCRTGDAASNDAHFSTHLHPFSATGWSACHSSGSGTEPGETVTDGSKRLAIAAARRQRTRTHALVARFRECQARAPHVPMAKQIEAFRKLCDLAGVVLPDELEALLVLDQQFRRSALKSASRD